MCWSSACSVWRTCMQSTAQVQGQHTLPLCASFCILHTHTHTKNIYEVTCCHFCSINNADFIYYTYFVLMYTWTDCFSPDTIQNKQLECAFGSKRNCCKLLYSHQSVDHYAWNQHKMLKDCTRSFLSRTLSFLICFHMKTSLNRYVV